MLCKREVLYALPFPKCSLSFIYSSFCSRARVLFAGVCTFFACDASANARFSSELAASVELQRILTFTDTTTVNGTQHCKACILDTSKFGLFLDVKKLAIDNLKL
jgi:hypothetical protein